MKKFNFNQRGVSLVEILVTLILISIAVLGSASMQVFAKRANNQAMQRTAAAYLAQDLMERMRSNRSSLENYLPVATLGNGSQGTAPAVDCAAVAANCTSQELAAFDLWEWEQNLDGATEQANSTNAGGLNLPTACITGPLGGIGGIYQVAIAWRGLDEHPNPTINDCGSTTNRYGANNEFRHVLVISAFIDNV